MRKRISVATILTLALLLSTVQADTIRLKNGSVIKGKVTSFADDQFTVLLDTGSGRSKSKATLDIADIAKIDFDSSPAVANDTSAPTHDTNTDSRPTEESRPTATKEPVKENPKDNLREAPPVDPSFNARNSKNRKNAPKNDPKQTEPKAEPKVTESKAEPKVEVINTSTDSQPPATEGTPTEKPSAPDTPPAEAPRKLAGARTVNVEVAAKRDWTSTGVIVKRGDRVRITATGNITLDASGQSAGPDGVDSPDSRKLMSDKPTGGLIGVIGADNDDFMFIGRTLEFTANRDGLLFLSVNEGTLSDNSGSFKTVIEVQAARRAGQ